MKNSITKAFYSFISNLPAKSFYAPKYLKQYRPLQPNRALRFQIKITDQQDETGESKQFHNFLFSPPTPTTNNASRAMIIGLPAAGKVSSLADAL